MPAVCWNCIEDEHLKQIIRSEGRPHECALCDRDDLNAFDPEDFARVLDPILREHFALGQDIKKFGEDDREWWEQEGEPLSDHLQGVIGQYLGFEDRIVRALEGREDARWKDGEDGFYHDDQNYISVPTRPYQLLQEWNDVSEELKHRRRFFSALASQYFESLFSDVETRNWWNAEGRAAESVVVNVAQATEYFRARACDSERVIKDVLHDPMKHVGPPPPAKARAGRMNVEGVVAFYGALDLDTCIAETRPAIGGDIAVIQVRTTRALRLIDFGRLAESFRQLSYFQPDFTEQVEKGAFLRRLQRMISAPILPGREAEYLMTQTMAEYLAHVHRIPFDGILFNSVQRSGGTNVVLFPETTGSFPITYVYDSVAMYSIESIQFAHSQRYMRLIDDDLMTDHSFDDEW